MSESPGPGARLDGLDSIGAHLARADFPRAKPTLSRLARRERHPLPIHHSLDGRRVWAFEAEIDAWLARPAERRRRR